MCSAQLAISWLPTSVEPVKLTLRTTGELVMVSAMAAAEPVMTLMTPAGMPARWASSASAKAE